MDVRCWLSDLTGSNCFFIAAFCLFCLLPLKPLCRSPLLLFTQRLVAPFLESAFSKIEFSVCLRFISPFKDHIATALTTKYYFIAVVNCKNVMLNSSYSILLSLFHFEKLLETLETHKYNREFLLQGSNSFQSYLRLCCKKRNLEMTPFLFAPF